MISQNGRGPKWYPCVFPQVPLICFVKPVCLKSFACLFVFKRTHQVKDKRRMTITKTVLLVKHLNKIPYYVYPISTFHTEIYITVKPSKCVYKKTEKHSRNISLDYLYSVI